MAERLTDRLVKSLEAPTSGNRITYDSEVKGFGLRTTAAGAKSFVLNYRLASRERRYTIGAYPAWAVAGARDEAKRLRRAIDQGIDPLGEREAERAAPTVADLAERYCAEHLPRKRAPSARDDRRMLRDRVLPELGRMKVADVAFTNVDRLHQAISRHTPIRANRVAALLSKMFNLAIRWSWIDRNPCHGVARNPERPRQRFLTHAEITRLMAVLDRQPDTTRASLIRFLLLTGCRYTEAATATWDQIELERGIWTKPASTTKQAKLHRVPLSQPALALLANLPRLGPLVFSGPGAKPISSPWKFWARVTAEAGIEGARIHDLRHSFASVLAGAGLSLPVIGALLGHTQARTTMIYAHLLDDPLRAATELAGAAIVPQTGLVTRRHQK